MVNRSPFLLRFGRFRFWIWNYGSSCGGLGKVLRDSWKSCWTCLCRCDEYLRSRQIRKLHRIRLFFWKSWDLLCFVFVGGRLCLILGGRRSCSIRDKVLLREFAFFVCIVCRLPALVAILVSCSNCSKALWHDALFLRSSLYKFLQRCKLNPFVH